MKGSLSHLSEMKPIPYRSRKEAQNRYAYAEVA